MVKTYGERIGDPLPAFQCSRNQPLRQMRLNSLGRHHVGCERAHLHFFERGTLTVVSYKDEILEPYVRLFTSAVGSDLILIDDHPFRAKDVLKRAQLHNSLPKTAQGFKNRVAE
ncbi:DDE_3 domain-containing protein [Trichonephila clavipes]|nr:DDE_3 domain-containing protein [Trichonephila clavipes]